LISLCKVFVRVSVSVRMHEKQINVLTKNKIAIIGTIRMDEGSRATLNAFSRTL
jgi:hypothetical protein